MIKIEDGTELAKVDTGTLDKPSTPLTVGALELALLRRYPREDAEPWDRTGLLVGDPAALVTGVAVALDATKDAIAAAERAGANVLLTHHPAFMNPPEVYSPSYDIAVSPAANVYAAAAKGIHLINFHTALDASVEATTMYARMLNLDLQRLLKPLESDAHKGYGMHCTVREADKPFKLAHLAARVTSVFGRPPRVWGDFDNQIKTVVIGNGGANEVVDVCLKSKADCLVCGEVGYHRALDASQTGLSIVEIGHDVSEFPLCALLAKAATDAGVPQDKITMVDQSDKWSYPDPTRM